MANIFLNLVSIKILTMQSDKKSGYCFMKIYIQTAYDLACSTRFQLHDVAEIDSRRRQSTQSQCRTRIQGM